MKQSELRLLPLNVDGVPRFDDQAQTVLVPEDDFLEYKSAHDRTMIFLNCWVDHREKTEEGLLIIADELDRWEHGCNISSVVGGIAGNRWWNGCNWWCYANASSCCSRSCRWWRSSCLKLGYCSFQDA
ncbi:hypothetical protein KIN20_025494 [Parelaphostrongylus tenuis]|uniref:Uncharacterized protein n=1 Tax=Parelaphostrongylus tenuis TaxID=148309 RepID=A0AAD5MVB0_PARTN|nr:hypothetical protein KIN20_025494 [Parelaphostrongylus tenuis]